MRDSASRTAIRTLPALDEITARQYAQGVLPAVGFVDAPEMPVAASPSPSLSGGSVETTPEPGDLDARQVRREDAVQAYVTGAIPVAEFLRIARA